MTIQFYCFIDSHTASPILQDPTTHSLALQRFFVVVAWNNAKGIIE